jgi:epoxyqueuosine reductase
MAGNLSIDVFSIPKRSDTMSGELRFVQYLEKNGCYGSVVSAKHVEELGAEIRALHDEHLLADGIYTDYGGQVFHPHLPGSLSDAKSIIVVATPQPMLRTTFHHDGNSYQFIVPPTYFDYAKVVWHARRLLKEAFRPKSYRLVRALLPLKLLAVRSGLAFYGKTNVTYVPKYGSFHRLTAFYSDYDSPVDNWQEKKALTLCGKCRACLNACPTGAIQKDRFLIRAERCLTYLNEKASKHEFPRWVDPSSHNALIGCMRCQRACPYDKEVANWFEDRGEFSEEETAYLLKGKFSGPKAASIEKKLKRLGLDLSTFPRNLQVLMDSQR